VKLTPKLICLLLTTTTLVSVKSVLIFAEPVEGFGPVVKEMDGGLLPEEINGTIYTIEQQNGFRVKKPKNSVASEVRNYLKSYPNCPKDTCTCSSPNHLDKKMKIIHGMCFDCVIDMEHQLRIEGKYEEYEQKKIRDNAEAWIKKAAQDVVMLKKAYTESQQYVTNSDGLMETWAAQMSPEEFEEKVEKQFEEFKKEFLSKLNNEENNETN